MIITYTDSVRQGKCIECGKNFVRRAIDAFDNEELCYKCYWNHRKKQKLVRK